MPKRPPKKWWKDCTKGVEKSGSAYDSSAVCGDLWYNKMSHKERLAATRKAEYEKRKKKHKN